MGRLREKRQRLQMPPSLPVASQFLDPLLTEQGAGTAYYGECLQDLGQRPARAQSLMSIMASALSSAGLRSPSHTVKYPRAKFGHHVSTWQKPLDNPAEVTWTHVTNRLVCCITRPTSCAASASPRPRQLHVCARRCPRRGDIAGERCSDRPRPAGSLPAAADDARAVRGGGERDHPSGAGPGQELAPGRGHDARMDAHGREKTARGAHGTAQGERSLGKRVWVKIHG